MARHKLTASMTIVLQVIARMPGLTASQITQELSPERLPRNLKRSFLALSMGSTFAALKHLLLLGLVAAKEGGPGLNGKLVDRYYVTTKGQAALSELEQAFLARSAVKGKLRLAVQ